MTPRFCIDDYPGVPGDKSMTRPGFSIGVLRISLMGEMLVPESEAVQILEAWVNDDCSPSYALASMLEHWGMRMVEYEGWDTPTYLGPRYHVVPRP